MMICHDPVCYVSNSHLLDRIVKSVFLTVEIDYNNIIVTNYMFTYDGIIKGNEFKKVLKKNNKIYIEKYIIETIRIID